MKIRARLESISRMFLRVPLAGSILAASAMTVQGGPAEAERPPNFVFIMADDLGWADLGCTGSTFYETPHIDRLAARGVRFASAYAACPVCSPTRAAAMTGKYPARLKLTDFIPAHGAGGSIRPSTCTICRSRK